MKDRKTNVIKDKKVKEIKKKNKIVIDVYIYTHSWLSDDGYSKQEE